MGLLFKEILFKEEWAFTSRFIIIFYLKNEETRRNGYTHVSFTKRLYFFTFYAALQSFSNSNIVLQRASLHLSTEGNQYECLKSRKMALQKMGEMEGNQYEGQFFPLLPPLPPLPSSMGRQEGQELPFILISFHLSYLLKGHLPALQTVCFKKIFLGASPQTPK